MEFPSLSGWETTKQRSDNPESRLKARAQVDAKTRKRLLPVDRAREAHGL